MNYIPSVSVLYLAEDIANSILWLLRFPSAGEEHLLRTAMSWAGPEVASRVRFTDVVRKEDHIHRCRVADLFLDTFQVCLPHFGYISANIVATVQRTYDRC
jgi:Glycosyl transferase family 41